MDGGWLTTSLFGLFITSSISFLFCLLSFLSFFHTSALLLLSFFSPGYLHILQTKSQCPNTNMLDMNHCRKSGEVTYIPSPWETNQLSAHRHSLNSLSCSKRNVLRGCSTFKAINLMQVFSFYSVIDSTAQLQESNYCRYDIIIIR